MIFKIYVSELRWYCTIWRKKSKKIKVNMKMIWVVHWIELYRFYINQVFSQLSAFTFRKKNEKNYLRIVMWKSNAVHRTRKRRIGVAERRRKAQKGAESSRLAPENGFLRNEQTNKQQMVQATVAHLKCWRCWIWQNSLSASHTLKQSTFRRDTKTRRSGSN